MPAPLFEVPGSVRRAEGRLTGPVTQRLAPRALEPNLLGPCGLAGDNLIDGRRTTFISTSASRREGAQTIIPLGLYGFC